MTGRFGPVHRSHSVHQPGGYPNPKGNFSSWQENKRRQDQFELSQNEKLKKKSAVFPPPPGKPPSGPGRWKKKSTALRTRSAAGPGLLGHKSAKMMKRAKALENRRLYALQEKEGLLKNLEISADLKNTAPALFGPQAGGAEGRLYPLRRCRRLQGSDLCHRPRGPHRPSGEKRQRKIQRIKAAAGERPFLFRRTNEGFPVEDFLCVPGQLPI